MPKPKHIPGLDKASWARKKWFVELVSTAPPIIAAIVLAVRTWETDLELGITLAVGAVWLVLASALKVAHAREQDKDAALRQDHDGLLAAINVLQATTCQVCKLTAGGALDPSLRVTIHRVVPPLDRPEMIEQIVPYVGGKGGGAGRKFSIRSGITGAAIRNKSVYTSSRVSTDEEAYVTELMAEWSYTEHDARAVSKDRHSSMAVPLSNGQQVVGVVYLDSDKRDLFAKAEIQEAIIVACSGINRYVDERYA